MSLRYVIQQANEKKELNQHLESITMTWHHLTYSQGNC